MIKCFIIGLISIFFISLSSFAQWEKANGGKELPDSTAISAIAVNGNTIVAATSKGIYVSTNNGENWSQKNSGLDDFSSFVSLSFKGNLIFLGTTDGIFYSSDNGDSWQSRDEGMSGESVYCFLIMGNNLFIGTSGGIYLSSDNGISWLPKNKGISGYEYLSVNSLTIKGTTIFAGTGEGVYSTTNNGDNWSRKNYQDAVSSIAANKNNIYLSGENFSVGIKMSSDNGNNWSEKNDGLNYSLDNKYFLLSIGDSVYAGGSNTGLYMTTNKINNWLAFNDGLSNYVQSNELMLAANNKYIFVGSKGANGFCNLWRRLLKEPQDLIEDESLPEIFKIYPNPVSENLIIELTFPYNEILSFTFDDLLGNRIFDFTNEVIKYNSEKFSVPVSQLSAGIYYIRLVTPRQTFITKCIISH